MVYPLPRAVLIELGLEGWTAALALLHITAHTAEHRGHLDAPASEAAAPSQG